MMAGGEVPGEAAGVRDEAREGAPAASAAGAAEGRQARLAGLRGRLAAAGLDAILITQADNRRYYSGFTGSSGWLLVSGERALLATDSRYWTQVARQCPDLELVRMGPRMVEALPGMLAEAGARRVAFEADAVTVAQATAWAAETPGHEWAPVTGWGLEQRAVKDAAELAAVRRAVRVADEALADALAQARPGMTERDLAWTVEACLHARGAGGLAFPVIVACGLNAAQPHAEPSDAPLVAGEPIIIDMGARVDGYCSDMTRTVCLGEPNDPLTFWAVYNTVLAGQRAGVAALRPGARGDAVDLTARAAIAAAGYGDYFGHGLGHGVGLTVGDMPRLSRSCSDEILAGSLVTVEPGVYLPAWGGVRIEDVVLVTADGAICLTQMSKYPIIAVH